MTDLKCKICHKRLGKVEFMSPVEAHGKDNGVNAINHIGLVLVFLCDECAVKVEENADDDD